MPTQNIAIIGMSCRFPGAENYQEYWNNLVSCKNLVRETPLSRWDWRDYQDASDPAASEFSRWAGFTDNPEQFDAGFFGISPREAERMDPQQRLVLEQAWHCIQDAGKDPRTLAGKNIGVYIAAGTFDYKELQELHSDLPEGHEATGVHNSVIANRISYFFSLNGPSVVVDTACSSSLVAMQQAASAIQLGHCESALVGGVGLLLTPTTFIRFGKMGMLSPTGQCSAFDANANGYVRGEGVGMVLLKPLDQALADGDHIWGVIKSVAINHGGKVRSLTSPSALAQAKLIVDAVQQADVPAHSINFIETHGTGTPLGDPIEIHGLTRAFNQLQKNSMAEPIAQNCGLGAVKANIGHLECAAGMAGLIKVLLAMKYKTLPGHANFQTINPRIKLADSPFHVVEATRPWTRVIDAVGNPFPLRAGISSFGFGGVNGHMIIEEAPQHTVENAVPFAEPDAPALLTISAASAKSLQQLAAAYATSIKTTPNQFRELCAAANQAQAGLNYRHAICANTASEMALQLTALQSLHNHAAIRNDRKVAFVYSGQGSQYAGMGAGLYAQNTVFKCAIDECERLLLPLLNQSITTLMFDTDNSAIHQTQYTQPALFALEYALTKMWQSLGINPDVIIGHSIGELAGACVAGVFSLEDALRIVVKRGQLMGSVNASGKMAAVFATRDEVNALLKSLPLPVDIAAVNAPTTIVISGTAEAVDAAVNAFATNNIDSRYLTVSQAFHSALMEPILDEFRQTFVGIKFAAPKQKLISNLTGTLENDLFCSPDYWVNHIRNAVQYQAGIETLIQQGVTHIVEIGPSPMLINLAKRTLDNHQYEAVLICSMKSEEPAHTSLLKAAGQLFEAGYDPDFIALTGKVSAGCVELPLYPFDRQPYWIPLGMPAANRSKKSGALPMPGKKLPLAIQDIACFEANPTQDFGNYLLDHKVKGFSLMPAAGFIGCASAALGTMGFASERLTISGLKFLQPLHLGSTEQQMQTVLTRNPDNSTQWNINIAGRSAESDEWKVHASAEYVAVHTAALTDNMDTRLFEQFKLIPSVPQSDFYQQCASKGLEYGPAFRAVTHAIESNGKVYGHLRLPDTCKPLGPDCFAIHPSLLDGALQLVTLLAATTENKIPLPVAVARFTLNRSTDDKLYAVAELNEAGKNIADIRLYNHEGVLVGHIDGLEFRWVNAAQITPAETAIPDFYFVPEWQALSLADVIPAMGNALVIHTSESLPLAMALQSRHSTTLLCDLGDYEGLARCLDQSPLIDRIYFIAPAEQGDEWLMRDHRAPLVFLLDLAQRLLAQGYDQQSLHWLILSTANHRVVNETARSTLGVALAGFVHSLGNEQAQWRTCHIDLDADNSDVINALEVIEKAAAADSLKECVVRSDHYWSRRLVQPLPSAAPQLGAYRKGGVYLITGGAQGIGAALAMKLAREQAAKLILVGRSPRNAQRIEFEQQLKTLGGEALYMSADVADYTALRAAVLQAAQQFGPIQGVIHSAGVIHDGVVQNLTPSMLEQVCAPKIQGTINLYRAVNDQPLDFMLLFSSVMAWLAYAGQANYVAANAFVDGFAHIVAPRSDFPVKVINWGHWGETGMASSAYYRERIARMGIHEITTEEGLAAIEAIITSEWQQLVVMKAKDTVLADMGVVNHKPTLAPVAESQHFALPSLDQLQDLQSPATTELLVTSLGALIAKAMRMDTQQLLGDKAAFLKLRFTSLGIDSLTTVDLRKRIRDWLGVDVPADVLIGGALIGEVIDLLKQQILLQRLSQANTANESTEESGSEDEEVFVL